MLIYTLSLGLPIHLYHVLNLFRSTWIIIKQFSTKQKVGRPKYYVQYMFAHEWFMH